MECTWDEYGMCNCGPCNGDRVVAHVDANEASHTPTPWKSDGRFIFSAKSSCLLIAETNPNRPGYAVEAEFIVRAVNTHDELLNIAKMWSDATQSEGDRQYLLELIARAEGK